MSHFLVSFLAIDQLSLAETKTISFVSEVGGDGIAKDDGTNPLTFAEDGDASYSGRHPFWVCLVCTTGTPVADMLAHSPPLPLAIDYDDRDCDITVEEEGIVLFLEQHDRVRRIRLHIPAPNLQNLIMIIDEECPVLHYGALDGEQEYGLDAP